jgi:hypothetical protein
MSEPRDMEIRVQEERRVLSYNWWLEQFQAEWEAVFGKVDPEKHFRFSDSR